MATRHEEVVADRMEAGNLALVGRDDLNSVCLQQNNFDYCS